MAGAGGGASNYPADDFILFHFILFIFPQQMIFIICAYIGRALAKNPGH